MEVEDPIDNLVQHANKNKVEVTEENLEKLFKISKDLSIEDVQQRISDHLETLYNRYNILSVVTSHYGFDTAFIIESLAFIKKVLFINKINEHKAYALLSEFAMDKENLIETFISAFSLQLSEAVNISIEVKSFLKYLLIKQPSLLDRLLVQLFDYCLRASFPTRALIIALNDSNIFGESVKLKEYVYNWLQVYFKKSQTFQNSLLDFAKKPYTTFQYDETEIENFEFCRLREKEAELFFQIFFESLVLNSVFDIAQDDSIISYLIITLDYYREYKYQSELFRKSQYNESYLHIIMQLLINEGDEVVNNLVKKFIIDVQDLYCKIKDIHWQQTNREANVQITELPKKLLELKQNESSEPYSFQQNELINMAIKPTLDMYHRGSSSKSNSSLKEYTCENLLLSSELTQLVIETPFDAYFYDGDFHDTPLNKILLKVNFLEYLVLLAFQDDDSVNFETLKNRFYESLDKCHPKTVHNDDNSRSLFKKSLKPFIRSKFIVSYYINEHTNRRKKYKWGQLLTNWKKCFETNDYTDFTLQIGTGRLSVKKMNYFFDETLLEYVCIL